MTRFENGVAYFGQLRWPLASSHSPDLTAEGVSEGLNWRRSAPVESASALIRVNRISEPPVQKLEIDKEILADQEDEEAAN